MKYIITGATSFIGLQLCNYLLGRNHEVYAVCRESSPKISYLPLHENIHIVYADMCEYRQLANQILHAEVFVNLAWDATTHEGREQKEAQWQNVEYSLDALMVARKIGCQLFVEAGSQAEYGITKEIQNDRTLCYPVTEYGRSKLTIGKMASEFSWLTNMKYLHLRIFSVYGEHDRPYTLINTCVEKMLKNEPIDLTPCMQNWNFGYVKDAAKQIGLLTEYALQKDDFKVDVFQIASEDTRSLQYFVKEIKEIIGSTSLLNFGALPSQQVVWLQPDIRKTKDAIGFISDYSFADGIKEIIKYKNK